MGDRSNPNIDMPFPMQWRQLDPLSFAFCGDAAHAAPAPAPAPAASAPAAAPSSPKLQGGGGEKLTKAEKKAAKAAAKKEAKGGDKAEKKGNEGAKKGGDKGGDKKPEPSDAEKAEKARAKLIKAVDKEGGKKGVEIEGACDMGGLAFFCTMLSEPDGDMEMLELGFAAMIAEPDPEAEERRGGAGAVGMMVFSAGQTALQMVCHVPKNRQVDTPNADPSQPTMEAINAKEWVEHVCAPYKGKIKGIKISGDAGSAKATLPADMEKGYFAIKMKDEAMKDAYKMLNDRHCFEDKEDSGSDFIIGENPCADDY